MDKDDGAEAVNQRRLDKAGKTNAELEAKLLGLKEDLADIRDVAEKDEEEYKNDENKL